MASITKTAEEDGVEMTPIHVRIIRPVVRSILKNLSTPGVQCLQNLKAQIN